MCEKLAMPVVWGRLVTGRIERERGRRCGSEIGSGSGDC
jgi:hypothetical protein